MHIKTYVTLAVLAVAVTAAQAQIDPGSRDFIIERPVKSGPVDLKNDKPTTFQLKPFVGFGRDLSNYGAQLRFTHDTGNGFFRFNFTGTYTRINNIDPPGGDEGGGGGGDDTIFHTRGFLPSFTADSDQGGLGFDVQLTPDSSRFVLVAGVDYNTIRAGALQRGGSITVIDTGTLQSLLRPLLQNSTMYYALTGSYLDVTLPRRLGGGDKGAVGDVDVVLVTREGMSFDFDYTPPSRVLHAPDYFARLRTPGSRFFEALVRKDYKFGVGFGFRF